MNIGDRIKSKRLNKNITLEELGKNANVSKATIQRYESGIISNIPSDKIEKIAYALDTTPAYLMGWEDEKNNTINTENIDYIEKLSEQYNLNEMDKKIIKLYISLTEKEKENVIEYIKKFTNLLPDEDIDLDIEKEVKEYRKALEEEKRAREKSSALNYTNKEKNA